MQHSGTALHICVFTNGVHVPNDFVISIGAKRTFSLENILETPHSPVPLSPSLLLGTTPTFIQPQNKLWQWIWIFCCCCVFFIPFQLSFVILGFFVFIFITLNLKSNFSRIVGWRSDYFNLYPRFYGAIPTTKTTHRLQLELISPRNNLCHVYRIVFGQQWSVEWNIFALIFCLFDAKVNTNFRLELFFPCIRRNSFIMQLP